MDLDLEVDQRVARQHARSGRFADALLDRLDVFLRNIAADNLVLDHNAGTALTRNQVDDTMAVLAAAAGLADELHIRIGSAAQRLTVRNLRSAGIRLDLEFADQAVENDLEVQLAHAGDDGLTGLLIGTDLEGRVLFRQSDEALRQLVAVAGTISARPQSR